MQTQKQTRPQSVSYPYSYSVSLVRGELYMSVWLDKVQASGTDLFRLRALSSITTNMSATLIIVPLAGSGVISVDGLSRIGEFP